MKNHPPFKIKRTKIVATIGPACASEKILRSLFHHGVDVVRINASHASGQEIRKWVKLVRKVSHAARKPVAVLVDLQGPRIRTGQLKGGQNLTLREGEEVQLKVSHEPGHGKVITTPYRDMPHILKVGSHILLDNGYLELEVLRIEHGTIFCRVITGGSLGQNKGINLPDIHWFGDSLTAKDRADLETAIECEADYIALSFVRSATDIINVKRLMRKHGGIIPVIAKIEKPEALRDIDNILRTADGVMVARGDLGIEMGAAKVPVLQKVLIERANQMEIPVITATQMLESMIEHPRPTRAEASDVANAIFDGTDAVMLSGETAIGKYPLECVKTMSEIISEAERHMKHDFEPEKRTRRTDSLVHAVSHAARDAAHDIKAKAIIVYTVSGKTALLVSKLKPSCPVIALVASAEVASRLALYRGVLPLVIMPTENTDQMIRDGDKAILKSGLLRAGDLTVIVSGRQALPAARYMAKVHQIAER